MPAHREDVKRAGEWVCDFIRRIGGTADLTPFGEKELALGEIRASSDPENAPTVLCYGHFDVQPPAPLDLWESDPFELTVRDEWAYARGITDDKGQVWILLKAAQTLVEQNALRVDAPMSSQTTQRPTTFCDTGRTRESEPHSGMYGGAAVSASNVLMRSP